MFSNTLSFLLLALVLAVGCLAARGNEQCNCSAAYDPVCFHGVTYPNRCLAKCLLKNPRVKYTPGACRRKRTIAFRNVCNNPLINGPRFCSEGYLLQLKKLQGPENFMSQCTRITHFEKHVQWKFDGCVLSQMSNVKKTNCAIIHHLRRLPFRSQSLPFRHCHHHLYHLLSRGHHLYPSRGHHHHHCCYHCRYRHRLLVL